MNSKTFAKSVCTKLQKKLTEYGYAFELNIEESGSHVTSKSVYANLFCEDNPPLSANGCELNYHTFKFSDHFNKGTAKFNYDISGYSADELNAKLAETVACEWLKKIVSEIGK